MAEISLTASPACTGLEELELEATLELERELEDDVEELEELLPPHPGLEPPPEFPPLPPPEPGLGEPRLNAFA